MGAGQQEDPSRPGEAWGLHHLVCRRHPIQGSRPGSLPSSPYSQPHAPPGVPRCSPRVPSKQKSTHPELSDTGDHRGSKNRYGLFTCFPSEKPAQREGPGPGHPRLPLVQPSGVLWTEAGCHIMGLPFTDTWTERAKLFHHQITVNTLVFSEALNILREGSKSPLDCEDDRTV